jgi:hypothetical protein
VYGARADLGLFDPAGGDPARAAGAPELVDGLRAIRVDAALGGPLGSSVERVAAGLAAPGATPACLMVMGAGDVEHVRADLLRALAARDGERSGRRGSGLRW